MTTLVMGIDIGTTSVKAVLMDENLKHKYFCARKTNAYIEHPIYDEQDVNKIFCAISECIQILADVVGPRFMAKVSAIAVCGQMHGCVFWKSQHIGMNIDLKKSYNTDDVSHLITWQDSRCDEEFLATLPMSKLFPIPLSSGFGCATIMWLKKNDPSFLSKYDCCGTIADYLVARLCALIKPVMSTQNAASWGYYNSQNQNWDLSTLIKAEFPIELLPVVACPGTSAGKICSEYMGMKHETSVTIALGDMQCSVFSCQIRPQEAVLNVSTSAQLSMVVERDSDSVRIPTEDRKPKPLIRVPYFGERDLLTSASLNGGDVFAHYVQMLLEWTRHFDPSVTEEKIYKKLNSEALKLHSAGQSLECVSTLFGERHDPLARAALINIGPSDLNVTRIGQSIVRGILQNIRSMFEAGDHAIKDIKVLRCCGGAFNQNPLFKELAAEVFHDVQLSFMSEADAAYGAALSVFLN